MNPSQPRTAPFLDLESRLLYRDGLMLVIDKPAGVACHKGPQAAFGTHDNLETHFSQLQFGLPNPPGLAHRLDRDTSGCLVLGRHRKALEKLGDLFKKGLIDKTYWAVVEGGPIEDEGLIDLPLGRKDPTRGWWMKVDPDGLPSQTRWRVMGRGEGVTALALEPLTGRTHQLRVHCSAMGWPILGDPIYGSASREGGPGLHLHARAITIPISKNKPPVNVTAPLPDAMKAAFGACGVVDQPINA